MYFATAGIETSPFLPVAAAFGISLVCSPAGISGAFLLLPFQISVLGYILPGVSATNQLFNILACPAAVYRFAREGRLLLPLALFLAIGTLPGVFAGAILRATWFAIPGRFQLLVGIVLIYLASRMLYGELRKKKARERQSDNGKLNAGSGGAPENGKCENVRWSLNGVDFAFRGQDFHAPSLGLILLSLSVGLVGGIYGIGGGAIMAPFLVSFFGLPIHALAGACLFTTFITSLAGVAFFSLLAIFGGAPWIAPDWSLGLLFGLGGMCGMYLGATLQKHIPARALRFFLIIMLAGLGLGYLF